MHIKYNFNLCLTQIIIIILFVINSITANLLEKNTKITLAGKLYVRIVIQLHILYFITLYILIYFKYQIHKL